MILRRTIYINCILTLFCTITGISIFSQNTCASSVKDDGKKYSITRNTDDNHRYLVDKNETTISGWHMRIGKKYYPLGKINDVGLYKTTQVKLIFTKKSGQLAKEECIRGIDFDTRGLTTTTKAMKKIGREYYFINRGYLQTTDYHYKGVKYFIHMNGTVDCYRKKGIYYSPSGKKLNKTKRKEAITRSHARTIIQECTRKNMSQSQKLDRCFMWVVNNYAYTERPCNGKKGWTSKAADALYRFESGDCRTLSTAFAFLASELGYNRVTIAQDSRNRFSGTHVWAVVNGKCYDPLFYNSARPKRYMPVFKGSSAKAYAAKTHCHASQTFTPGD